LGEHLTVWRTTALCRLLKASHSAHEGALFHSGVEARSGSMSKTTAKIIKKHAMLAGHRTGSDPMFLHRTWLLKLSIKVQVLNANLVATCMPYADAYHTRSATRNAVASVHRAVFILNIYRL
jgi:hypothetical protein